MQNIKSLKSTYLNEIDEEGKNLRDSNYAFDANHLSLESARKNALKLIFDDKIYMPSMLDLDFTEEEYQKGKIQTSIVTSSFPINEIRKYIDWRRVFNVHSLKKFAKKTNFFRGMLYLFRGMLPDMQMTYPEILSDEKYGVEAKKLFADANALLDEIEEKSLLELNAVHGIFQANSDGDDIIIYEGTDLQKSNNSCCCSHDKKGHKCSGCGSKQVNIDRTEEEKNYKIVSLTANKLHSKTKFLRFNMVRRQDEIKGEKQLCISDFIAPVDSGMTDYVGVFAVTAGLGAKELSEKYENEGDIYKAILVKILADSLAEALAERLHELVRKEYWGYSLNENLEIEQLLKGEYQGIRPEIGCPSIPDHSEKIKLSKLLGFENIGVTLTESFMLEPVASICGLYFAHPESHYFDVGRIYKDQLADFSERKKMTMDEIRSIIPNRVE